MPSLARVRAATAVAPLALARRQFRRTKVTMTIAGGKVVFERR